MQRLFACAILAMGSGLLAGCAASENASAPAAPAPTGSAVIPSPDTVPRAEVDPGSRGGVKHSIDEGNRGAAKKERE
jgi:hypothetical protein